MGKKLKVLFLCDHNRMRSPTAERIFSSRPELEVQSAGLAYTAERPLQPEHIAWADVVFVMEPRQERAVAERFGVSHGKKLICLDIPDEYAYMDPRLVSLLELRVSGSLAEAAE